MTRPSSFRGMVFDMDGVIVDGEAAWHRLYERGDFLAAIAPEWSPESADDLTGLSLPDLHRTLTERFGATLSYADFLARFHDVGERIYRDEAALMPGARATIRELRDRGVQLAVASNSPRAWIDITLERFVLADCFVARVSSDDVSVGKPAPEVYEEAVRQLGMEAAECCAVEDTDIGVEAAVVAGLYAIGFRHADNAEQSFAAAHRVVASLSDVLEVAAPRRRDG